MHPLKLATPVLLCFALAAAAGEGFKVYPGATTYTPPDTEETRQYTSALRPGTTITAYLTNDSFEKVVAFYKGFAQEYLTPGAHLNVKLPNGQELKKTFLILDGAPDLRTSRSWLSIQHPFVAAVALKGGEPKNTDIRDVTEIIFTQRAKVQGAGK